MKRLTPSLRFRLFLVGILLSLSSRVLAQAPVSPLSLHPANHRYFLFRGEPTVLVTSGEHYGLLLNRAFDFETYFDELALHGLNHTRVFSGVYREVASSFGITQNTLAPTNDDYLCPWQRTDKAHEDGSPIFDLEKWDDAYFQRLDAMMRAASKRGIVVEMCLFCPMYKPELWDVNPMNVRNNVNSVGDCGSTEVYTTDHEDLLKVQGALAEKMVEALLPYDNVYIEICNEPYFGGVTDAWQRRIIDIVVDRQKQLGSEHLISVNVANKTKRIEDPHGAISIFNFHYCHPPVVVAENQHIHGVIGENETGFRGKADLLYRTEGWDFLVAGGGLYNNLDYSFTAQHPGGTLTDYQSPGGGGRDLRHQLSILKSTFERLPLTEIKPQPDSFVTVPDRFVASAIGQTGKVFLVYVHVELPGRIDAKDLQQFTLRNDSIAIHLSLPDGTYQVEQVDTESGKWSKLPDAPAESGLGADISVSPFVTDTALLIQSPH